MADHVTEEQIRALRDHSLNDEEWWLVTEHTSTCAVCRTRLGGSDSALASVHTALQRFDELLPISSRHLSEEEILAWVERDFAGVDRSAVEAHLSACARCRDEASEAMQIMGQPEPADLKPRTSSRGRSSFPAWAWATAAALVLSIGTSIYLSQELSRQARLRAEREQRLERELADRRQQIARLEQQLTARAQAPVPALAKPLELDFDLQPRDAVSRGSGPWAAPTIRIPADTATVRLSFEFTPRKTYVRYQLDLQNADGETIWSRGGLSVRDRGGQRVVSVSVPGRVFAGGGRYTANLNVSDAEGARTEANYEFRVLR